MSDNSSRSRGCGCLLPIPLVLLLGLLYWQKIADPEAAFPEKLIESLTTGWNSLLAILGDALPLFLVSLFLLLFLLSNLTLPVRGIRNRAHAFIYLLLSLVRLNGPFVCARDGGTDLEPEDRDKTRPGLLRVDLNSAVVIGEKQVRGEGFWFTKRDEKVRGAVDLRRQTRSKEKIQSNTREGIKIRATITVDFSLSEAADILYVTSAGPDRANIRLILLDVRNSPAGQVKYIKKIIDDVLSEEDERLILRLVKAYRTSLNRRYPPAAPLSDKDKPPFPIDAKRVVAGVEYKLKDVAENQPADWIDFPVYLATRIFRDNLIHEQFDDIFRSDEDELKGSPLDDFQDRFSSRVILQGLVAVQYAIRRDGAPLEEGQEWVEDEMIFFPVLELEQGTALRERGIKVIRAGFSDLEPVDEEVRKQMLKTWQAKWVREEQETQADSALQAARIRNRARVRAQRDMVYALSQIFQTTEHSKEALAVRIYQALETVATDPVTRELLSKETIQMFGNLRRWLLPEKGNGKDRA